MAGQVGCGLDAARANFRAALLLSCSIACSVLQAQAEPHTARAAVESSNPQRPPDFWAGATVTHLSPGDDLAAALAAAVSPGKHVVSLASGSFDMPAANHLSFQFAGDVQLRGQGINVTYVNARGYQSTFIIGPGASFEVNSLTVTGASGNLVTFGGNLPGAGVNTPTSPELRQESVEWWRGADDTDLSRTAHVDASLCPATLLSAADPSQGCDVGSQVAAQLRAYQSGLIQVLWGNESEIVYDVNSVYYPPSMGYFKIQFVGSAATNGVATVVYHNSSFRATATPPVQQPLFDWFVSRSPEYNGSQDCYSPNDFDWGFTYRGTASKSKSGLPCLRWDDENIPFNVFWPNTPGKFTSTESNYCRNPVFYQLSPLGPWCNVFSGGKYTIESCGLPACSPASSSSSDAAVIAAVCASVGGVCVIAALLVALALLRRRRRRQRSRAAAKLLQHADDATAPPSLPVVQPWHVHEPFQSLEKALPLHVGPALASGVTDASVIIATGAATPAAAAAAHGHPPPPSSDNVSERSGRDAASHATAPQRSLHGSGVEAPTATFDGLRAMLAACGPVDSVAPIDLQSKYGAAWTRDNVIDTSTLLGSGTFGQVYRGLHGGRPAAFKVIHSLRPLDGTLRFVRKNVLPVVLIQRAHRFPLTKPHLLPLEDCVMFPPWSSLQALARGTGAASFSGLQPQPSGMTQRSDVTLTPHATGTHLASTPASPPSAPHLIDAVDPPTLHADHPLPAAANAADSNPPPPSDAADPKTAGGSWRVTQLPKALLLARRPAAAAAGPPPPPDLPAADPDRLEPPPSQLSGLMQADLASDEVVPALWYRDGQTDPMMTFPKTSSSVSSDSADVDAAAAAAADGDDRRKQPLVLQVIMVMPLCELGTLYACIKGRSNLPISCLPAALRGLMSGFVSVNSKESISEDAPQPGLSISQSAIFNIKDLPELWRTVLKVQLCLQVVDGVMALHKCQLIHCDIKPQNIFLTANGGFEPFGVCARIGDMDTCRSLQGVHDTGFVPIPREERRSFDLFEVQASAQPLEARRASASDELPRSNPLPRSDLDESCHAAAQPATAPHSAARLSFDTIDDHVAQLYTSCLKGTPGFLAPEMILQGVIAPTTDVYSLGVSISIVLAKTHRFMFGGTLDVRRVAEYPDTIGEEVLEMMVAATQPDPRQRPPLSRVRAVLAAQLQLSLVQATAATAASSHSVGV